MELTPRQLGLADQVQAALTDHIVNHQSGGLVVNETTAEWFDKFASEIVDFAHHSSQDVDCCAEIKVWTEDPTNDPIPVVCYPFGLRVVNAPQNHVYLCYEHHENYIRWWMNSGSLDSCAHCEEQFASGPNAGRLSVAQFATLVVVVPLCNKCVFGEENQ